MGEFISVRGKNLYVEQYGYEHNHALLYLHGGPGASCLDFCYHQAKALSRSTRVISFDQRGVLRSDSLEPDEPFGLEDILEDCEVLRNKLGIKKWSLLGHSFGGYLALYYAHKFPNSIKNIIYEAPAFDMNSSVKSMLKKAQHVITTRQLAIEEINRYMNEDQKVNDLWRLWAEIGQKLGEYKDDVYLHSIDPTTFNQIYDDPYITSEHWARSKIHTDLLIKEGLIFKSLLPILKLNSHRSLLLHGKYDPVCSLNQLQAFDESPNTKTVIFENSAHFPRIEEPDKYTATVERFLS